MASGAPDEQVNSLACNSMEYWSVVPDPFMDGCRESISSPTPSLKYFSNRPDRFSNPLFIHPLSILMEHAVGLWEKHSIHFLRKRLFSTQMDCFSRHIYKRRAGGASMGIRVKNRNNDFLTCCPQDRDPHGLLAFSRSPGIDPLFINEILTH